MKKLLGIMIALLIFTAPMATYAQVEAIAGSLKIGAHVDTAYHWSGKSKNHPGAWEIGWEGYDSVNVGDVYVELVGKVGDRITFKITEGLVKDVVDGGSMIMCVMGTCAGFVNMQNVPMAHPFTLEAFIDVKIIDQLKIRVGKQITPTLLANTGVHKTGVVHTANAPLIANGSRGFNHYLIENEDIAGIPNQIDIPNSVTGAAIIAAFSGVEVSYTWFDNWLVGDWEIDPDTGDPVFIAGVGDALFDFNKTKGGNVALGYAGEVGPGKLAARVYYFDEDSELAGIGSGAWMRITGWGLGASYTHTNFFVAMEYANNTAKREKNLADPTPGAKNDNNWQGLYFTLAGKFSGIEPVYRLDWIDYTDFGNNRIANIDSLDTEMWHTIGVNYWFNDNAMVGLDYVIKVPEVAKGWKYPNINELVIFFEVDTL